MTSTGRKIAVNVFTLMRDTGFNQEEFATRLNYSYRDMYRILEGKFNANTNRGKEDCRILWQNKTGIISF